MPFTETFEGTITRTYSVARFEVIRNAGGGGKIKFAVLQYLSKDGQQIGIESATPYEADFADLPATFPVEVNGNIVQVSGQTILDALDAVALAVVQAQA